MTVNGMTHRRDVPKARWTLVLGGVWSLGLLTACGVAVQPVGEDQSVRMSRSEFRDYARSVFDRQNAAVNALVFQQPELPSDSPRRDALEQAESRMIEACAPLVDAASQRQRGGGASFTERRSLPEAVVACDHATQRVERLLEAASDAAATP